MSISGARYSGVPQKVVAPRGSDTSSLLRPKSVMCTWPSASSSTFSGLRSRYTMSSECRCESAHTSSAAKKRTMGSGKVRIFLRWKKSSPPRQ